MLLHLRRITYKIRQCTIYGTYAGNVSLKIVSYVIYMRTYQTVQTVYTVCIHMRNTRDFVIVKNKGPSTPVRTHVDYNLVLCLCCVASALYKKDTYKKNVNNAHCLCALVSLSSKLLRDKDSTPVHFYGRDKSFSVRKHQKKIETVSLHRILERKSWKIQLVKNPHNTSSVSVCVHSKKNCIWILYHIRKKKVDL